MWSDRSSAEDPDALAARLAAQLAPEVAPTRSMAAVVVASPCSVATVTQHLVDELQLDAAVGFGSHREAFCEACDGAYQCINPALSPPTADAWPRHAIDAARLMADDVVSYRVRRGHLACPRSRTG